MYSFWSWKKKLRIKWSISLLNPLEKCKKQPRKGGDPEDPDIKIIMYVYTPLNKVFGFQGSNQIFGGWNCFSIPFLFEPSLKPFLKPSRLFEWKQYTPNSKSCLKSSGVEKTTRLKWSISLLNPLETCKKQSCKGGGPGDPWHQNNNVCLHAPR